MNLPSVSIVGTRNPSEKGRLRARNIAILVSDMGFGVTSGLAKGIDTAAHLGSISSGGQTIAVIGTNLSESYPKENYDLQEKIAKDYLLISQFPFNQPTQAYNFPQRNQTMSGLTRATIIVEAGETSGALIQAEQCLRQKRKLFILNNLLENTKLNWPKKYIGKDGVFVVTKIGDLISELEKFCLINEPKRPIVDLNASLFENGL
jgi:DNA processing protein